MLLLRRAGYKLHTTAEFEIVRTIKEKYCHLVSTGYKEDEGREDKNRNIYRMPDGEDVELSSEKFKAPEILFSPEAIGFEYMGVHEMVVNSIKKCDVDLRKELYGSIIIAGGTTCLTGFGDRLHKSVVKMSPKDMKVTLIAPQNRKRSCWIGGATLANLEAFKKMWITRKDYNEMGTSRLQSIM